MLMYIAFVTRVCSQSYETQWTKTYGGPLDENGYTVHQTADEGYVISGYSKSLGAGESDAWLVKTNAEGDTLWTRTFGGDTWDWGEDVLQTEDGGYLLVVRCYSFGHGNYDAWIIRTDPQGDTLWTKIWGEDLSEWLTCVQQTADRGYIFTGRTMSFGAKGEDAWVVRSDSSGEILWMNTYGGEQDENASFVQQTDDDGFIVIGRTYSYNAGKSDIWLVKTNSRGDTLWTRAYGGPETEYGTSVRQTKDGGYILVGNTTSYGAGDADIWLIKTDSLGDALWTRTFGGTGTDLAFSLSQMSDGNYLIGGYTNSFGTGSDDGWLIFTDENGDTIWTQTFGGENNEIIMDSKETSDGKLIIVGYSEVQEENYDLWLMKISLDPALSVQNKLIPAPFHLYQNHPNPFNTSTTFSYNVTNPSKIKLELFNADGSLMMHIFEKHHQPGEYQWEWNPENLDSGIFLSFVQQ